MDHHAKIKKKQISNGPVFFNFEEMPQKYISRITCSEILRRALTLHAIPNLEDKIMTVLVLTIWEN
jgi:hypothetical protein